MPVYRIYERAFHPDENFGLGGMGFKGDNRGYSFMLNATARVWSVLSVDTSAPTRMSRKTRLNLMLYPISVQRQPI